MPVRNDLVSRNDDSFIGSAVENGGVLASVDLNV